MFLLLTFALVPGLVRVGHMRFSVFGILAAAGLIAAIAMSERTAKFANVSAQRLWDAGVFSVAAALVISRILLVAEDPKAFLRYPLIVLSLPSLTYAGIALTVIVTLIYLRVKQMPMLAALDAWTPCAAIFGGALSVAHFIEGTDAGMPTSLPWGVLTPGDTVLGRVHPVQLYLLIAAIYLFFDTLRLLQRSHAAGAVAAHGLYLGGGLFFLLDMLAQPAEVQSASLLDPGQYIALGCFAAGLGLRSRWLIACATETQSQPYPVQESY
jgi:phosphatidylglycerol---prolipoprotein diacylglyceryl transferase